MTANVAGDFEFPYTQADFEHLRDLITPKTGIMLPDGKKTLVYSRLVRRLRALQLTDFATYIQLLQTELQHGVDTELTHVINAITTNVTSFFRENHHFDLLAEHLPELLKTFGSLRVWSMAASTGEEPWSIAMVVQEFLQKHPTANIKILASDLDNTVLHKAQAGVYTLDEASVQGHPLLKKYLHPVPPAADALPLPGKRAYQVKPVLQQLVKFQQQNLVEPWSLPYANFHVVLCRNVIIYFSKETQRQIFQHLEPRMPTHSVLCIGHSESLMDVSTQYKGIGRTAYTKL